MDISKDELLRLVSGEQAFDYVCAQNAVLAAQVKDYRVRLDYLAGQIAAEQFRHAKLAEKQAAEYNSVAAAHKETIAALQDEITEMRESLRTAQSDIGYYREQWDKSRAIIANDGAVGAMTNGAIKDAVAQFKYHAEFNRGGRNKIAMIKSLREKTGVGLREAKEICEQIIAAMDAAADSE